MKLLKHYDFTNDKELNRDDWNVAVGEKWSNNELQHYVDKKENLFFDNGLVIKATYDGKNIESSRIHTKNKFSFKVFMFCFKFWFLFKIYVYFLVSFLFFMLKGKWRFLHSLHHHHNLLLLLCHQCQTVS